MPVEKIDPQIQRIISDAEQKAQRSTQESEKEDQARERAERKKAARKQEVKQSLVARETSQRSAHTDKRLQQLLRGSEGPEVARALGQWQSNAPLQAKLTEAQKQIFRQAMANRPQQAARSGEAMVRLAAQPGFHKAVSSAQQMGTLQEALLADPGSESLAAEMLSGRFMQSPHADREAKGRFLRFGFEQLRKGQPDAMRRTGDMLGTLSEKRTARAAQRAAMSMAQRLGGDAKATNNLDSFVRQPVLAKLPRTERGEATKQLAKADAKAEVKDSFVSLAKAVGPHASLMRGRLFATVGLGRPSEYRELAEKLLLALRSKEFPKRGSQVQRFLSRTGAQVARSGARSVDPEALIKEAKTSELPVFPDLEPVEDLTPQEARKRQPERLAKIVRFFTKTQRGYEQAAKKLGSAKYFEDIRSLANLRQVELPELSDLTPEEQAFCRERGATLKAECDRLLKLQRERLRELRHKRMPPAKRRAKKAAERLRGTQPRYFVPKGAQRGHGAEAPSNQTLAANLTRETPREGQRWVAQGGGGGIEAQVREAVSQLQGGPINAEAVGRVAQNIARQVAQQVAQQVTEQLLGKAAPQGPPAKPQTQEPPKGQQGKVDGWGIPRTFEQELGGTQREVVKPASLKQGESDEVTETAAQPLDGVITQEYTGRILVKDPTQVRGFAELFTKRWKSLGRGEQALLKNLGWNQQLWDTKETSAAKWPMAMATAFVNLNPTQREAVRKLGFTPHDWDERVQAFQMSKNA